MAVINPTGVLVGHEPGRLLNWEEDEVYSEALKA